MNEPTADPSVRERIERQVRAAIMAACDMPERDVQRWKRDGNQAEPDPGTGELPGVWIVVYFADEDASDDEALGTDEWLLPFTLDVHLQRIPDGVDENEYANRWMAALHELMAGDPQRTEADTQERLALDTRVRGRFGPTSFDGQREVVCGIEGEIHYRHDSADPWTVG